MNQIKVSKNQRFLARPDGTPFFYLADTGWELFHRFSFAEADTYLQDRASKRFTVIQAMVLAEHDGLTKPNLRGHFPLHDLDPSTPNEAYFQDIDHIISRANRLGLTLALVPTWGDKWNKRWGAGPEIFTPENAYAYGRFLGDRYRDAEVIWLLGGDRPVENQTHRQIIVNMGLGLSEGDGGTHLKSFHPMGRETSSQYFHNEPWLDFNMWQSGHDRNRANYDDVAHDYGLEPPKPCMDGEPGYEEHPAGFKVENGYLDQYDCRKSLYWGLFAGGHGHTYGCHPIWQKYEQGMPGISWVRTDWRDALNLPGSDQMRHGRALIESRPYFSRIPDQELIAGDIGEGCLHVQATRDRLGRYAMIYVPSPRQIEVDPGSLAGENLVAHWFNPRTGSSDFIGIFPRTGILTLDIPHGGPDWVLTLDNEAEDFPRPGSAPYNNHE